MKLNDVLLYFYEIEAVCIKDLDREVYMYIYDNYSDVKGLINFQSVGVRPIYSLSRKGRRYVRDKIFKET